jgi:hypothetical protein
MYKNFSMVSVCAAFVCVGGGSKISLIHFTKNLAFSRRCWANIEFVLLLLNECVLYNVFEKSIRLSYIQDDHKNTH